MKLRQLSKNDTGILKGVAILCILAHNFFHWMGPIAGTENEFSFKSNNFNRFIGAFADSPIDSINIIFSYLGHYGVMLFIFISGYGLATSMMQSAKNYKTFVIDRAVKLYPLVFVAIVSYYLMSTLIFHRMIDMEGIKSLVYKLLMVHTLIPGEGLTHIGPLWFAGMIFQLYLLFPLLFKLIMRYGVKAFAVICLFAYVCIYLCLYIDILPQGISIMQNFIGHLPEFCLGILFVKLKGIKLNSLYFIIAVILFCIGNLYKSFFPFTFISITYIMLCFYHLSIIKNKVVLATEKFLAFFGKMSMMLFATHSIIRAPLVEIAEKANNHLYYYFMFVVFVVTALFIAFGAKVVYEWIVNVLISLRIKLINARCENEK